MADEATIRCLDCQAIMSPVVLYGDTGTPEGLLYRRPEDSRSFWTGRYPPGGQVRAFMCADCGRIVLYGSASDG